MICQQGVVKTIQAGRAVVRFQPGSTCAACARGKGCGMGLLAGAFGRRRIDLSLDAESDWVVGDRVAVSLASTDLSRLALRAYGAPLLAFLAGVGLAAAVLTSGPLADFSGLLLGVASALGVSYWLGKRTRPPTRIRRVQHDEEASQ